MVNLEEPDAATVKIIDLGLAKAVQGAGSQPAISMVGVFVGTPEFASPEQFSGVPVDIRSDLYSLGATLWQMLAGHAPFRGTPGGVMHQHLHTPLTMGQLGQVPHPPILLLEVLLEKNPSLRFHNPPEMLPHLPPPRGTIAGEHI